MNIEEICTGFFIDNRQLASIVLLSYQRQIPKNHNIVSLVNFIINTKEFKHHFNERFDKLFVHMISNLEVDTKAMKRNYLATRLKEKKSFMLSDLEEYIKETDEFYTHYAYIIRHLYDFYFRNNLSNETLTKTIEHVKNLSFRERTSDEIEKHIREYVSKLTPTSDDSSTYETSIQLLTDNLEEHKRCFVDLYRQKYQSDPKQKDIVELNEFFKNKNNLVNMYFSSKYNDHSVFYETIVKIFKSIFHRDITVFEYIKYYNMFSQKNVEEEIGKYHQTFERKYDIVMNIFNNYLNMKIDHLEFIHKFLDWIDMDESEFLETVTNTVIKYPIYKREMDDKIDVIYNNTFGKHIMMSDKTYFFQIICTRKVNLVDEYLTKLISELKEETDKYEATINEIFTKVLKRLAERSEMETYIELFRYPSDNMNPVVKLENELYECFEYHDILKELITELYPECKVNKSVLFSKLNKLLKCEDPMTKRDIASIKLCLST